MNHEEEGTVRHATNDMIGKKRRKTHFINNKKPSDDVQANINQNKQNRLKINNNERRKINMKKKEDKKRADEQRYYDILANKVISWAEKWFGIGILTREERDWVLVEKQGQERFVETLKYTSGIGNSVILYRVMVQVWKP